MEGGGRECSEQVRPAKAVSSGSRDHASNNQNVEHTEKDSIDAHTRLCAYAPIQTSPRVFEHAYTHAQAKKELFFYLMTILLSVIRYPIVIRYPAAVDIYNTLLKNVNYF